MIKWEDWLQNTQTVTWEKGFNNSINNSQLYMRHTWQDVGTVLTIQPVRFNTVLQNTVIQRYGWRLWDKNSMITLWDKNSMITLWDKNSMITLWDKNSVITLWDKNSVITLWDKNSMIMLWDKNSMITLWDKNNMITLWDKNSMITLWDKNSIITLWDKNSIITLTCDGNLSSNEQKVITSFLMSFILL